MLYKFRFIYQIEQSFKGEKSYFFQPILSLFKCEWIAGEEPHIHHSAFLKIYIKKKK